MSISERGERLQIAEHHVARLVVDPTAVDPARPARASGSRPRRCRGRVRGSCRNVFSPIRSGFVMPPWVVFRRIRTLSPSARGCCPGRRCFAARAAGSRRRSPAVRSSGFVPPPFRSPDGSASGSGYRDRCARSPTLPSWSSVGEPPAPSSSCRPGSASRQDQDRIARVDVVLDEKSSFAHELVEVARRPRVRPSGGRDRRSSVDVGRASCPARGCCRPSGRRSRPGRARNELPSPPPECPSAARRGRSGRRTSPACTPSR